MDKSSRRKSQKYSRKSEKGSRRRKTGKESRGKKRLKSRTASRKVKRGKESRQRTVTLKGIKFFAIKSNNLKTNVRNTHVMITTSGNKTSSDIHYQVVRNLNDLFNLKEYGSNGGSGNYWTNATNVYNLHGNPLEKYAKNGDTLVHLSRGYQFQIDFLKF